jgi:hypothetical protein
MGITVTWYNETQTVIQWQFAGRWTWERFAEASRVTHRLAENSPTPLVLLIEVPENVWFPPDTVGHVRQILQRAHPNIALRVIVTRNATVQTLLRLILQLNPRFAAACFLVQTRAEAQALIDARQAGV